MTLNKFGGLYFTLDRDIAKVWHDWPRIFLIIPRKLRITITLQPRILLIIPRKLRITISLQPRILLITRILPASAQDFGHVFSWLNEYFRRQHKTLVTSQEDYTNTSYVSRRFLSRIKKITRIFPALAQDFGHDFSWLHEKERLFTRLYFYFR